MSVAPRQVAPTVPNDLEAFFVPFTPNRAFKKAPRLIVRAKDMHYYTPEGKPILDGSAGMWCCNAGHNRPPIVEAIQQQAGELDYPPAFQFSHPKAFELASRTAALRRAISTMCSSAIPARKPLIRRLKSLSPKQRARRSLARAHDHRERGYHGVGFGDISVGGIVANRKMFGTALGGVDHLPHTYNREQQASPRASPMGRASGRRSRPVGRAA